MGRRGPPKGEGGAPRKEINLDVARRAASIGCTAEEIAALLGVVERRRIPTAGHPHTGKVIPGTLATDFRDFGDRDSGRLGVILGTLATKLIGDTNNFPISFGR
jgi:hypothetical protein